MNTLRLPYHQLSPKAYRGLLDVKEALDASSLETELIELIYLRISQINGCAFCLEMHANALRKKGEGQHRLDALAGWEVSPHYSDRERAALEWSESLTNITQDHASDTLYTPLKAYFTDAEISDLTFAIALMNAFNRLAIGMRQ